MKRGSDEEGRLQLLLLGLAMALQVYRQTRQRNDRSAQVPLTRMMKSVPVFENPVEKSQNLRCYVAP